MRDIKFRAWDGEKLRTDFYISLDGDIGQFDSHEGLFVGNMHTVKLMQYTGLKDKNGKEIYEGDILQNWAKENYPVVYTEEFAQFEIVAPVNTMQDGDVSERFEVIGNIYENPEMLNA